MEQKIMLLIKAMNSQNRISFIYKNKGYKRTGTPLRLGTNKNGDEVLRFIQESGYTSSPDKGIGAPKLFFLKDISALVIEDYKPKFRPPKLGVKKDVYFMQVYGESGV